MVVRLDGVSLKLPEVDRIVEDLMGKAHVTGLALAVLNHSEIVYLKAFGLRNVERSEPLTVDSVMYGASLTKSAFAYMVLQLVDQKAIDLDRPVTEYLRKPLPEYPKYADLAADDRYKLITARTLLSHTAGASAESPGQWWERTPGGSLDDLKATRTMVVSTDMVAADAFGISLLDRSPADLPYLRMAAERGAGRLDYETLHPVRAAIT